MASRHETVVQAIENRFRTIVAGVDGYVYTPDLVRRVMFFPENWAPDPTLNTLYFLRPGLEPTERGNSSCEVKAELELFLVVMRRLTVPSENPSGDEPPERWMVSADLVSDVRQAIYREPTFGVSGVRVTAMQADWNRPVEGWAEVEIRFVVTYTWHSLEAR